MDTYTIYIAMQVLSNACTKYILIRKFVDLLHSWRGRKKKKKKKSRPHEDDINLI